MDEILKFKKFNELKKVYRWNSVESRKESSAEHTWSSLMLADFFLIKISQKIDKLRVYELLMYHDVIEIETGDIPLDPKNENLNKKNIEIESIDILKKKLPLSQGNRFVELFSEFEENKTVESKFANAIDKFDAIIQEIDYKSDWIGWNKQFLRNKKEKFFVEFPEINNKFQKIIKYLEKEKYFNQ